ENEISKEDIVFEEVFSILKKAVLFSEVFSILKSRNLYGLFADNDMQERRKIKLIKNAFCSFFINSHLC
ncbi:hypothetical protein, partial [Treponema berlinense]|uniref:hypothetical protein n=1 Tax=Treponema berlinense TaxID=225004 RepID=UPI003F0D0EB9